MSSATVSESVIAAQHRDEQIERYQVLGRPPGRDLQALVDLTAQVCVVPVAIINLLTSDHAHALASSGVDPFVCERQDSMCSPVLTHPDLVVVSDATADARYADNPMVTGVHDKVRFYASVPLRASDGDVIGRLCVFDRDPHTLDAAQQAGLQTLADRVMDVLDLRLRNRQLEQSLSDLRRTRDELRRSNDQLTLFARQVSHDLRTPLTGITLNIESLLREPAVAHDPDLASLAVLAQRSGERMAGMIEQFLEQATHGATALKGVTDLRAIVDDALHDLAPALQQSGAEVSIAELPTVCADPTQLYSVMLNLICNAVKFARPGCPPRITVCAETMPDRWRVEVGDNGIGIPADQQGAVFDLFTRLDTSVSGSGIGLATARRIVTAHGGRIGITTDRKVGTEVWFELPR